MNGRFAVIGLSSFGVSLARHLSHSGAEVTGIDRDRDKVEELSEEVDAAVIVDCTDSAQVASLELDDMDAVIVAVEDDIGTMVLILAVLLDLGLDNVYVRVTSEQERRIVSKLGARGTIFPAENAARSFARSLLFGGNFETLPFGDKHSLLSLATPSALAGRTVASLKLREKHGLNLVTVMQPGDKGGDERCSGVPVPEQLLSKGDKLILFGLEKDLRRFLAEYTEV